MPGFDTLYKQTVTVFNRVKSSYGDDVLWYATVIEGVHLIVDKSSAWTTQGEKASDNAKLHIRYRTENGNVIVAGKPWYEPKAWRALTIPEDAVTFNYGDAELFDFFMEGAFDECASPISDEQFGRKGFYAYMNSKYDNVFAITSVSKKNLIPHFEISGR